MSPEGAADSRNVTPFLKCYYTLSLTLSVGLALLFLQLCHPFLEGVNHGACNFALHLGEHLVIDWVAKLHINGQMDRCLVIARSWECLDMPLGVENFKKSIASLLAAPCFDHSILGVTADNAVPIFFETKRRVANL